MLRSKWLTVAALVLAGGAYAQEGDTLQMGGTDNAARFEQSGKPARGMTQSRVRSEFGSPQSEESAVGEPPITRWHYSTFVVYFEHDRVIHAVAKR